MRIEIVLHSMVLVLLNFRSNYQKTEDPVIIKKKKTKKKTITNDGKVHEMTVDID